MAPYIPVPNTLQAEFRYTMLGQQMENVLNFYQVAGWTLPNASTFAQTLITWWNAFMGPQVSTQMQLREVYLTYLDSQSGFASAVVPGSTIQGQDPATPLPPQTAFCITLRTGSRGRSFRGRFYACGATEAQNDAGQAIPGYGIAVRTALTNLISIANTANAPMVIVSRRANNQARLVAVTTPVVAAVARDNAWDSMRSRSLSQ